MGEVKKTESFRKKKVGELAQDAPHYTKLGVK